MAKILSPARILIVDDHSMVRKGLRLRISAFADLDTHRENIKRKLGIKNAAELNRQAVQFLLENS